MSGLDWYPRNSRKALDGMRHLTLEQRGAYNTIIDLIYERGGPIPDDDRWLAGQMGVSVRKWKQLRQELVDDGRIIARGTGRAAVISDEKAEAEIAKQSTRRKTNEINGGLGGRKTAEKRAVSTENNYLGSATATPAAQATLKLIEESSVANATGAEAPVPSDPNKEAWDRGVALLRSKARMSDAVARTFFGKLLSEFHLEGRDLLAAVVKAESTTEEPRAYLRKCAAWLAQRRGQVAGTPEDRVAAWSDDVWDKAVEGFKAAGRWSEPMGPAPDKPGCKAPDSILDKHGFHRSAA